MLGWINDCLEKLIVEKYGLEVWHNVKEKTGCAVGDDGFLKLENYRDESTVALATAAGELIGVPVSQVFEMMGVYFVKYISNEGYDNLMCCQGSTLKDWMTNINAIHAHLQSTFPKKMVMPEFWCQEQSDGTLLLFYHSARGNYLAPLAIGIVKEVAIRQFELDITMAPVTTQGVDGAKFTSWIVGTEKPEDLPKLKSAKGGSVEVNGQPTKLECPMSGHVLNQDDVPGMVVTDGQTSRGTSVATDTETRSTVDDPFGIEEYGHVHARRTHERRKSLMSNSSHTSQSGTSFSAESQDNDPTEPGSLSALVTKRLFPYHMIIDREFCIISVGNELANVLGTTNKILFEYEIDEAFEFVQPRTAKWTRSWLRKLMDQEFTLTCTLNAIPNEIIFKGTLMTVKPGEVMLILSPDAKSLEGLREMGLTLSDLPAHGAYRDSIFLREHLSRQINNALKMEKLSKTLKSEKVLLEKLLPHHAAEGLRRGKAIKPMLHNNVTMFFSDIVGFTKICKKIPPCEIITMLNRLYGIMDFLANVFKIFKIETIGDAYVCCSGLPENDENHAINVANFSLAVQHCCRNILSPVDGSPIQLRIGIHSGSCASGIVGMTNPRYCVFGDTVNTCARHESTGEAGRVHCSLTTMIRLHAQGQNFKLDERGMVDMKGKGQVPTYWLTATEVNPLTNVAALEKLDDEIKFTFQKSIQSQQLMGESTSSFPELEGLPSPPPKSRSKVSKKSRRSERQSKREVKKPSKESTEVINDDDSFSTNSSTSTSGSMSSSDSYLPVGDSTTVSKEELVDMLNKYMSEDEGDELETMATSTRRKGRK